MSSSSVSTANKLHMLKLDSESEFSSDSSNRAMKDFSEEEVKQEDTDASSPERLNFEFKTAVTLVECGFPRKGRAFRKVKPST